MATTTRTGAIYGIGTYGTSVYGVSNVAIVPDPVTTTGTTDPDVIIEADANHVITSVQGVVTNGGVGEVFAGANVPVTGTVGTVSAGDVAVAHNARPTFDSVDATGSVGTTTIVAAAVVVPTGILGTAQTGTATITAAAVTVPTGTEGTVEQGTATQKTVNRVPVTGVEGTGAIDDVVIVAEATIDVTGVAGTVPAPSSAVRADSNTSVTGVEGTTEQGTNYSIFVGMTVYPVGVRGTSATSNSTVTTVRNVFDANNRNPIRVVVILPDEDRIVYVAEDTPRVVQVDAGVPRIVYVKAA